MTLRILIGTTTLVLGLLPLAVLAQETAETTNGVSVTESQPARTQTVLQTLTNALVTASDEDRVGLRTAIDAIEEASDTSEDGQSLSNQEALETLQNIRDREDTPEDARFGLDIAIDAVSDSGVDGRAVSDDASEDRSNEAGDMGATSSDGKDNAGGMGSDAAGGNAGGAGAGGGGAGGGSGGAGGGSGSGGRN